MSLLRKSPPALRWTYWTIGTLLSFAAIHGRWELPVAAWLCGLFLLRFTRTSRVWVGLLGGWLTMALGVVVLLAESGLPVFGPLLLGFLPLGSVPVLAYLVDRLVAGRIPWPLAGTLVFPAAVVAIEFGLATFTPMGTALTSLAATQHDNLPLLQLASVTGGYGISFLVAWLASVGNWAWEQRLAWQRIRAVVLTYAAVLALVLTGGAVRMATTGTGDTVRVAGVTWSRSVDAVATAALDYPSYDDAVAADPAAARRAFDLVDDDLLASTEREAAAGARIVVWPEAGAVVLAEDRAELLDRIGTLARRTDIYVLAGLNVLTGKDTPSRNEAVLITPSGRAAWSYEKSHPVPGLDDLDPGDGVVPTADTPHGRLAAVICFDADFPALMRQAGGVDLMLVPSNDWPEYGRTHTEKATVRAIENGYTLVRQDSNGLARTVDPLGRTIAEADFFATDQQTMVAFAPTSGVSTVYSAIGDVFAWLCVAGLGGLTLLAAVGRRTRTE
jgi:apolipoprotein N-acyltransferase